MEVLKERYEEKEMTKQELMRTLVIAAGIDIISFFGVLSTLGLGVVIEEAIEYFISQQIAKFSNIKLSSTDNLIGTIPIPGVTAVTVYCARKLFALKVSEKF